MELKLACQNQFFHVLLENRKLCVLDIISTGDEKSASKIHKKNYFLDHNLIKYLCIKLILIYQKEWFSLLHTKMWIKKLSMGNLLQSFMLD